MGTPMPQPKKSAWSLWQALTITVIAYFLSLAAALFASVLLENSSLKEVEQTFTIYAVNTIVLLAIALIFITRRHVAWKNFFQLPKKSSLLWLPVYFAAYFMLTTIVQTLLQAAPGYNANQDQQVGFAAATGVGLALVFIALVVFPPFGEEVIFRGILYPGLKTKMKKIIAAIIASTLFGLAHWQWNVGADTFVLSMVAIYAYEKHNTLWLPIGLHAIKNFVAFLALFVFKM